MKTLVDQLLRELEALPLSEQVTALNEIRQRLHEVSPFRNEPVDCVRWVPAYEVRGNTYNPNSVAPVEMELLRHSIQTDGYTQPIVGFADKEGRYEVVDGFHRHRVGKESDVIRQRVHGYLPLVSINEDRQGEGDRMAATIRHNRARGKHQVGSMSEIVVELARRNWDDAKIAKELGMDADEVLRLKQITGLADIFANEEFSEAWEPMREPSSEDP